MRHLLPLIALAAATIALPIHAQTEVLTGVMRGKDYGVTYRLPRTEIALTVTLTHHVYTPGEFCKYADKYLRLGRPQAEADEWWTMDQVATSIIGIPDPAQTYFVKLKDKTTAPLMELTADGIVRSINIPYSKDAAEEASTTSTVATPTAVTEPAPDPHAYLTEEMLMVGSSAKMAELVAKEIYSLRESKSALNRGEADYMPTDGTQLQLMLNNLDRQERALTSMFMGPTTTTTTTVTLRITPHETTDEVAFRFSRRLGLLSADNLAGEPVRITIEDLHTVQQTLETDDDSRRPEGIAYNVPGRARVTLDYNGTQLFNGELPVTQFGTIDYLAAVLFNKNTVTRVLFDTATGGLIKVDRAEQ